MYSDAEGAYYVRGNPTYSESYIEENCTNCPGCRGPLSKESPVKEDSYGDSSMSRYGYCATCDCIVVETLRVTHAEIIFADSRTG